MKHISFGNCLMIIALLFSALASQGAGYTVPKREFRSAWIATVWALDWPRDANGNEANNMDAATQKASMIRMLDSLKNNNFNAVNFQVRSMCDAMYESSYEPWSSYLTGTRGKAPSYDPLKFVVDECHKRGMECPAWPNPYRFSSGSNWNTAADQAVRNGGHLLTYGTYTVLDPAQQWTIDRIVAVVKEIITKYDVDGVLYDDYFYPNGIETNADAGDYTEWQDSIAARGSSMSLADWRRDNVNRMVKAVYDMIQSTKPYIRFGISPAGVAATSSAVASKYGVPTCPAGSDWQYNGIFSDPLAWISSNTIDYISPQVYWKIGASADYSKITPWWNKVSAKFGRQCYISQNIYSSIKASSTASDYAEVANESELNRTSSVDGNPGAIYYSCKYLYALGAKQSLANYLKSTVFSHPALPPALPWKQGNNPGKVQGLALNGNTLSWTGYDDVRYSVYAFPVTMNTANFTKQVDYLQGMSYGESFVLDDSKVGDDWQYAVCVVDRVGNEYDPVFLGNALKQLDAPRLIAPAEADSANAPFNFVWSKVPEATSYIVELSHDASFSSVAERYTTADTTLSALKFTKLAHAKTVYWRVQSCASKHYSGVSQVRSLVPMLLTVTYPANGQEELSPGFTAQWYTCGHDVPATLEISGTPDFAQVDFAGTSATGSLAVPADKLETGNTYYMRVRMTVDNAEMVSPVVCFTLAHEATHFVKPLDKGVITRGTHITLKPQSWATSYVVEVSTSSTTWGRTRFVETLKGGSVATTLPFDSIKVGGKYPVDGTTYYARTKTSYDGLDGTSHTTAYGDVISFVYRESYTKGDVNGDGVVNVTDVTSLINAILGLSPYADDVCDLNADGKVDVSDVSVLISMINN